jgi:hypothetical protein
MNALALILFLPWFIIVGAAYWFLPRESPRSSRRNRIDALALLLALVLSAAGMALGMQTDTHGHHPIWAQVLATLYAYGAFLGVLASAAWLRAKRGR